MKRIVRLTGVPANLKDQVVEGYRHLGAKVTATRKSGKYSITAEFPTFDLPADPTTADEAAMTGDDVDRPARSELETESGTGAALYYPLAIRDLLGSMKTLGEYAHRYPRGAIVHYTAGRDDPRNDIRHAQANGYCYFVIGPDGATYQNFPLDRWGSHAGISHWPSLGNGVSRHLVGIEICNAGKLRELENGRFRPWYNEADFLSRSGRQPNPAEDFPADRVRSVRKKHNMAAGHYLKFTELQEAALIALLRWLHGNHPSVFSYDLVLGHDEVSPGRKVDPGGALSMTMPELRTRLKNDH